VALYWIKKKQCWIWKALDRDTRRVLARVIGRRDATTFRRLYDRVKGTGRVYYTDDWPTYSTVLPTEQHVIGKAGTPAIERDNADTRHYLARMTRGGKVASKSLTMVDLTMKLHVALTNPETCSIWQDIFLSVFE
jgi:insertion element IS1 protein InsB